MFTNEYMKFNFKPDQVLTTYAYEISRSHRERVRPNHFVHIAKADMDGKITYQYLPILVNFQDSEPIKNIALKIFKGLRTIIHQSLFT
jgi:hypothetical protein